MLADPQPGISPLTPVSLHVVSTSCTCILVCFSFPRLVSARVCMRKATAEGTVQGCGIYMKVCMHVHAYEGVHTCIHAYMRVCIHVYACICICMYACAYNHRGSSTNTSCAYVLSLTFSLPLTAPHLSPCHKQTSTFSSLAQLHAIEREGRAERL